MSTLKSASPFLSTFLSAVIFFSSFFSTFFPLSGDPNLYASTTEIASNQTKMCIVFIDWSSTGKQWFRATSYVEPCLCWEEVSVKRNRSKTNLLVLENKSFRKFFLHLEEVLHVGSSSCDRLSALWTQQRIQTQPEF